MKQILFSFFVYKLIVDGTEVGLFTHPDQANAFVKASGQPEKLQIIPIPVLNWGEPVLTWPVPRDDTTDAAKETQYL
jgi:hypothetical protein